MREQSWTLNRTYFQVIIPKFMMFGYRVGWETRLRTRIELDPPLGFN